MRKPENELWKPEIENWKDSTLGTYQLIFSQAKERFEEKLSESESMTNKAIKILSLLIASTAALVIFKPQTVSEYPTGVLFFGGVLVADLVVLFILLFPKNIMLRGTPPKEFSWEPFDNTVLTSENKEKMAYLTEIIQLQHKIGYMRKTNLQRQGLYRTALILSIIVVVGNVILSISVLP